MPRRFTSSLAVIGSLAVSLFLAGGAKADVNVNIYSGFQLTGGGAPFSGLVGSFTAPVVDFGTVTNWNWRPVPNVYPYGADITSFFNAPTTGAYVFALNSDGSSELFLNNALLIDNTGAHREQNRDSAPINLTGGQQYPLEVQFFEAFGPGGGVDVGVAVPGSNNGTPIIPANFFSLTKNAADPAPGSSLAPEPSGVALLLTGGLPLLGLLRRRKQWVR